MGKIKIFRLNEMEWWAGESLESCVAAAMEVSGLSKEELLDDFDLGEVGAEGMEKLVFLEDDDAKTEKTFKQKLDEMIAAGEKFPCCFAVTEY